MKNNGLSQLTKTIRKLTDWFLTEKGKKLFSVGILLLASVIWGLAFSAQKDAGELGGFTVGASRNLFATLFLIPIIPLMDRLTKNGRGFEGAGAKLENEDAQKVQAKNSTAKKIFDFTKPELIGGAISGLFMTFATVLQQNGIGDGTDAGKAGFITALYVVIVPIYALFFRKKSPPQVWVSIGIAVVGFYLLSVKSDFSIVPSDLLILLCAFIFAGQIMAVDIFSPKCDGVRLSIIQFATGFVLNAIFALIFESPISFALIGDNILSLLFLGVFSSGIAYTLQVIGQKNLNPGVASILLSLESVFGAIGGALIFGETMSPREIIGSSVVFFAVILSQIELKNIKKADNCK
jgi:drug/metabolite transporter (DMT)-like permease